MIRDGTNLVALASEGDIVGHTAVFFIDRQRCEMLTVVWPQFQGRGIGTELVRSSIHLALEMGFGRVWLSVDGANLRARHIYKKCGFECLSSGDRRDVEMALDLKGRHDDEQ
jgi:RimJ/RimL family protein N-acetyltransferase